jgi:hypothetical protein
VDERIKVSQMMTLSDYLELHYSQLALHSEESGVTKDEYVPNRQVIVSLTSHGNRIFDAYLAIESIMQGTVKPNRIILWLPDNQKVSSCYLEHQMERGLEIKYVKDLGPHTKLIHALKEFPDDIVITIDDDIFYKPDMVENLLRTYKVDSSSILANRVAVITKDKNGNVESYLKWIHFNYPERTSKRNVIIGVEGCLYPPHSFSKEVFNEEAILELCPTADDIWFTAMAILNNTRIVHVDCRYDKGFAGGVVNLRMQKTGLVHLNENQKECRNDFQIRAVFDKYNIYPLIG